MNKPQCPYWFSQSSTSLFGTLVVNKPTAVSKSGMDLFMINKNFTTTEWNNYSFLSLIFLASSLTLNNLFVAGDVTNIMTSSPNIYMHSSNCSAISNCIVLSFISVFVPKKVWFLPLTIDSSPKLFFTSFIISDITSGFLCYNLLSSTYQEILHCLPSITLFSTHLS